MAHVVTVRKVVDYIIEPVEVIVVHVHVLYH